MKTTRSGLLAGSALIALFIGATTLPAFAVPLPTPITSAGGKGGSDPSVGGSPGGLGGLGGGGGGGGFDRGGGGGLGGGGGGGNGGGASGTGNGEFGGVGTFGGGGGGGLNGSGGDGGSGSGSGGSAAGGGGASGGGPSGGNSTGSLGVFGGGGGGDQFGGGGGGGGGGSGGNGAGGTPHGGGGGGGGGLFLEGTGTTNTSDIAGGDGGEGNGVDAGGGGGGGGLILFDSSLSPGQTLSANATITNLAMHTIKGGNGGSGSNGGGGGAGVFFQAGGILQNRGTITGGAGGDATIAGGLGGDGGAGMLANGGTITNTGTIQGGNGGASDITSSVASVGGEGIQGWNLEIATSGTITGGMNGDGTQALAIHFIGGTNSLTLEAGWVINGDVVSDTVADTQLLLGGDDNASFDVSTIGNKFQGFSNEFVKTGDSTWALTHTTSEHTDWLIEQGALAITSDGALGSAVSTVTLRNGGVLRLDQDLTVTHDVVVISSGGTIDTNGHNVTLSGSLSGGVQSNFNSLNVARPFLKQGTGNLILTGDASGYTRSTEIAAGGLQVGDASTDVTLGGDVNIDASATLAGYGTVGGINNTAVGSITQPGGLDGSIGTLHADSYNQDSSSILRIAVSPTGASQLAVTNTASLAGTLDLAFAPGVYQARNYTILTAGSVTGKFDNTTHTGDPGREIGTQYSTSDVQLVLGDPVTTPGGGNGGGTVTVAPSNGQVMGATTSTLVSGTQLANQSLFNHLSDQRFGGDTDNLNTAFAGSNPAQVAFAGDMAALNDIVACLPEALAKNGGWFRGLGGFGSIDSTNGAPGIDSYGGGFMAGYDRAITDHVLLGVAAGYTRTQINGDDNSNASIDTPRVSLYSSYHLGGFALDGSVGYAFDRIKSQDQSDGGTARSKHDAHEINAALQASYNVKLPNAFVLTPHTGLDYLHIFEDGYNEHGAGAFDLQAESSDTDSLRPQVGVGVSRSFATDNGWHLIPQVDLTYSREMLDNKHDANVVAGGGSFTVDGLSQSRDQLALNLDLTAQLSETVDLSLGYTQVLPVGNTTSYNFTGGVRVLF